MAAFDDALARSLALRRLQKEDTSWKLMRAELAPVILGILGTHLGGEVRRMPVTELVEAVDADLDGLRDLGFDLPLVAQAYCSAWRADGYLIRRPSDDSRGETYELSAAALGALRTLTALADPRPAITESRLTSIAHQLSSLATDTDPDQTRRLSSLLAQRDALDAEISRVRAGDITVLDDARATERTREILKQITELPGDFAQVRTRFEGLNRLLHERLIESEDSQRKVLGDVFRGVDLIADSDAGRSFSHFLRLVLDPELGAEFDRDIDRVLDRDFVDRLEPAERRALRRLLPTLKREGSDIHSVITAFARGLRRYVQSQQYQRDRALRGTIREALAAALRAAPHTKPYRPTQIDIELSGVSISSVGALRPHDPSDFQVTSTVSPNAAVDVDWQQLRDAARDTEIDFDELTANIRAMIDELGEPTIAQVLERYPATQGVGSVIGLLALADESAVAEAGDENISWVGADGIDRTAPIPRHRFLRTPA
ncbi:DUF3375 domain-containing protein [Microbacterium sp. ZW T5_56]|uniref:DUF3375 domain-containing protein n=1 Tax=Microbacterium sp. ZW T5_56 TaxID=3378081 RepID=UPI003854A2E5